LTEANPVQILAEPQHSLYGEKQISNQASGIPYCEAVWSLFHLSQITRPGITLSVNLPSRYVEKKQY